MNIKELVKDNKVKFSHYRCGMLYYHVVNPDGKPIALFPIDITETKKIQSATFDAEDKAIGMMSYIVEAINKDTLIEL